MAGRRGGRIRQLAGQNGRKASTVTASMDDPSPSGHAWGPGIRTIWVSARAEMMAADFSTFVCERTLPFLPPRSIVERVDDAESTVDHHPVPHVLRPKRIATGLKR